MLNYEGNACYVSGPHADFPEKGDKTSFGPTSMRPRDQKLARKRGIIDGDTTSLYGGAENEDLSQIMMQKPIQ